jgi:hypothetical protein
VRYARRVRATAIALATLALVACRPPRPEWTPAPPTGDAAEVVRAELARAHADRRALMVYVGASWCEPCQRFHRAFESGALDAAFPRLRVLAFDLDRDAARLRDAGYVSRLIPLFAVPLSDGRASGRQIEGSIKGEGAVGEIAPRLRALLDGK